MRRLLLVVLLAIVAPGFAVDLGLGPVPTNATLLSPGPIGSTTPSSGAFTTLSATGAITSTLASGTAPFTVTSSTVVGNLNVSQLLGGTWAVPGTIGSTTPNTAVFSTARTTSRAGLSASSISTIALLDVGGGATNDLSVSTQQGGRFEMTATSSATGSALGLVGLVSTTAASYTCGLASAGYFAFATLGSGSAVTRCAGQVIEAPTSGTNNAAINIISSGGSPAWTGNYAIRSESTLASQLAGTLSVANTTDATSSSTGAVTSTGGASFAKNIIGAQGLGVGVTSTATAAGTTTLTTASTACQVFTGTTTQTMTLPAANAFGTGVAFVVYVKNLSTGAVTVSRAGSDTINSTASNVTSFTLAQWASCTLYSDGVSAWERF